MILAADGLRTGGLEPSLSEVGLVQQSCSGFESQLQVLVTRRQSRPASRTQQARQQLVGTNVQVLVFTDERPQTRLGLEFPDDPLDVAEAEV